MTRQINMIFSLLNLREEKQTYKAIDNLEEAKSIFKNDNIDFIIDGKKYSMNYDNEKEEIEIKKNTKSKNLIGKINNSTSFEQIFSVFGSL